MKCRTKKVSHGDSNVKERWQAQHIHSVNPLVNQYLSAFSFAVCVVPQYSSNASLVILDLLNTLALFDIMPQSPEYMVCHPRRLCVPAKLPVLVAEILHPLDCVSLERCLACRLKMLSEAPINFSSRFSFMSNTTAEAHVFAGPKQRAQ